MSVEQPRGMDFSGTPEEEEPMLLLAVNAEAAVAQLRKGLLVV